MPTISVIVPVYNSEKSIERCISTLCSQKMADIDSTMGGGIYLTIRLLLLMMVR